VPAPFARLKKGQVGVPRDVDPWCRVARRGEQRLHLCLIRLKQHDFDWQAGFLAEEPAHAFPDRDDFRIVRDRAKPNGSM
jgi:hypothetical protein